MKHIGISHVRRAQEIHETFQAALLPTAVCPCPQHDIAGVTSVFFYKRHRPPT